MTRKSFLIYFDWEEPLQELNNEELGELFKATFIYAKYGEEIDFEHRSLKLVFGFIKSALDRDREAYKERCKRNKENAEKGAKKKADSDSGTSATESKSTRISEPDIDIRDLLKTVTPAE